MTMQYKIFVPLILAFFVLPFAGNAQKDLPAEQVEVLKQFEATLLDTKKQTTAGTLPQEDRSTNKLTYSLPTKNLEIQHPAPKIRPLGMRKDKLPEPYKGYVKAGYGIPASPYAEFGYHFAGAPFRVNIHAKHHAANFKNLENQKFAKSFAEIDTKYSTESNIGFSLKIVLTIATPVSTTSASKSEKNWSDFIFTRITASTFNISPNSFGDIS